MAAEAPRHDRAMTMGKAREVRQVGVLLLQAL